MTPRFLQAVLRSLAAAAPPAEDGELLRKFAADRSADAFAELVRRHGRLVWTVCRHLTRSDAEADDAFQATFLVLLRNAGKVRDPGRLSAWLHGVAYRVCSKARQSEKRRTHREQATATPERNGSAVPDSGWDRALAAVHEEAGKLPETLRVPFVLCCLEGRGVTEAAAQLGWKLSTLSGRLTRAKDAILARLDARGLTLAAVAGLGVAAPPAEAVARAAALIQLGHVIPGSVLQLSQGVIGMNVKSVKVLAAAVVMTCGLGVGVGTGVIATADAQAPGKQPAKADRDAELKRLQDELDRAKAEAAAARDLAVAAEREARAKAALAEEQARKAAQSDYARAIQLAQQAVGDETKRAVAALAEAQLLRAGNRDQAAAKTRAWEYDFVAVSPMTQAKFVAFLDEREGRGWEYNGLTRYLHEGKMADVWVFRRPPAGQKRAQAVGGDIDILIQQALRSSVPAETPPAAADKSPEVAQLKAQVQVLQAQLADLNAKLAATAKTGKEPAKVVEKVEFGFEKGTFPLTAVEVAELLGKLAEKKFGKGEIELRVLGDVLAVTGSKEVCEWATRTVKSLSEK